jgi:hypothetical protein
MRYFGRRMEKTLLQSVRKIWNNGGNSLFIKFAQYVQPLSPDVFADKTSCSFQFFAACLLQCIGRHQFIVAVGVLYLLEQCKIATSHSPEKFSQMDLNVNMLELAVLAPPASPLSQKYLM